MYTVAQREVKGQACDVIIKHPGSSTKVG